MKLLQVLGRVARDALRPCLNASSEHNAAPSIKVETHESSE